MFTDGTHGKIILSNELSSSSLSSSSSSSSHQQQTFLSKEILKKKKKHDYMCSEKSYNTSYLFNKPKIVLNQSIKNLFNKNFDSLQPQYIDLVIHFCNNDLF